MLEDLKVAVCDANLELVKKGLVIYTWGNVSGISRDKSLVVIKPSGIEYSKLTPELLVVLDLDGNIVEGNLKPSSDAPTHLQIYKAFPQIGGIVHTHSRWSTIFAQAGSHIPTLGTTHADYFYGQIPCTRRMFDEEIDGDYEKETGNVIVETFQKVNPIQTPGVVVYGHGPFCWGKDPQEAVYHAVVMEEIAMMAFNTISLRHFINQEENYISSGKPLITEPIQPSLLDKHFLRKHGKDSYYGQIT